MNKIKFILISLAVIGGVGAAFAKRSCVACESQPQYYKSGSSYLPAGIYGDNYACRNLPSVCSYYQPDPVNQPTVFVPCRNGVYQEIPE